MTSPDLAVVPPVLSPPAKLEPCLTPLEGPGPSRPLSPPSDPPPAVSSQSAAEDARSTTPEIPPSSPSTGQRAGLDDEKDEPSPRPVYSPGSSRPGSPMSLDCDGAPGTSSLQDVDEKDASDLSHLGKLHLEDLFSDTVHRIWLDDLPDEPPPEPDSHFPSRNPWPTADFTAVGGIWSNISDTAPAMRFSLPSGRPTPVSTPSTIPDRYSFSSPPSRVSLSEPSNLGLVYRRRYLGDIVTLGVGPENVEFQVHKEILTKSSPVFARMFDPNWKEASEGKALLGEDDPNAWSLIVDWLYCGRLPPFKPVWAVDMVSCITVKGSATEMVKRIPLPSYFGPPVSKYGPPREGQNTHVMRLAHLCTQPLYETMSADELRFVERHMGDGEWAGRYFYYLQSGTNVEWSDKPTEPTQRDDAIAPPSLTEQEHRDMYLHLTTKERIPIAVPFPGFVEAEFLQVTLVKVMILAHKYALDDLFNDAMDLYRCGEKELERRHPVIRHIELAYAFCSRECPLVTLMADAAAFLAKLNRMAPEVVEFAGQCTEFRGDLMARHDARVGFPGFNRRRDTVDVFQCPLSLGKGYHVERELGRNGRRRRKAGS